MKLWRKFKFFLLQWLLDDICAGHMMCSECPANQETCEECFYCPVTKIHTCATNAMVDAAEKAWGLK